MLKIILKGYLRQAHLSGLTAILKQILTNTKNSSGYRMVYIPYIETSVVSVKQHLQLLGAGLSNTDSTPGWISKGREIIRLNVNILQPIILALKLVSILLHKHVRIRKIS